MRREALHNFIVSKASGRRMSDRWLTHSRIARKRAIAPFLPFFAVTTVAAFSVGRDTRQVLVQSAARGRGRRGIGRNVEGLIAIGLVAVVSAAIIVQIDVPIARPPSEVRIRRQRLTIINNVGERCGTSVE